MSIMNLGSGMSTFIGPAIAGVFFHFWRLRRHLDLCFHVPARRYYQLHVAHSWRPGAAMTQLSNLRSGGLIFCSTHI